MILKLDGVDTTKLFTGSFTHSQKIAVESVTIPLKLG
jgi:hypothetical protein